MWSLEYLSISVPSKGRYKTTPPSPNVIKSLIQVPRQGQVTRTKNKKTIVIDINKNLSCEIQPRMKTWVDIIPENANFLGGHRDHVSACLCHMLYCIETSTPYNLAFFILKRMEKTRNKPKKLLPYGMLLTRLFKHVAFVFSELAIDHYLSHDRRVTVLLVTCLVLSSIPTFSTNHSSFLAKSKELPMGLPVWRSNNWDAPGIRSMRKVLTLAHEVKNPTDIWKYFGEISVNADVISFFLISLDYMQVLQDPFASRLELQDLAIREEEYGILLYNRRELGDANQSIQ
ncbi:hypothetical protein Tco_0639254 [Tanacetum coccineum]